VRSAVSAPSSAIDRQRVPVIDARRPRQNTDSAPSSSTGERCSLLAREHVADDFPAECVRFAWLDLRLDSGV